SFDDFVVPFVMGALAAALNEQHLVCEHNALLWMPFPRSRSRSFPRAADSCPLRLSRSSFSLSRYSARSFHCTDDPLTLENPPLPHPIDSKARRSGIWRRRNLQSKSF